MNLRLAEPSDLAMLRHWDAQPHIVAAFGDDEKFNWPVELVHGPEWRELLIAEVGGCPVGVVQIIDPQREEAHYWGDVEPGLRAIDLWIGEETDLGRGFGTSMMSLSLDRCFNDSSVMAVLVDPLARNTRAHRFYERFGFHCVERRKFCVEDCLVFRLDRAVFKQRANRNGDGPSGSRSA